jgi:uncharacterized membrane protein YphA (DoxX/SURF4 family)
VGLLLLRVTLGVIAARVGALHLAGHADMRIGAWIAASLAIAGGISLMIGFFTPGAGAVVVLGGVVHGPSNAWLVVVVAVAIIMLGPGAFSLDARLFGRREIVIRAGTKRRNP